MNPAPNTLPAADQLKRLAVSDSGFVFDPVSGLSYTLNPTALFLLEQMKLGHDRAQILSAIGQHYEVEPHEAGRDLNDFIEQIIKLLQ